MKLTELTCREEILAAYEIYQDCMYRPTEDRFRRKMEGYLADPGVRIWACRRDASTVGLAVVATGAETAELLGIAVARPLRRQGRGSCLLRSLALAVSPKPLLAETDADAVDFYRRCGCQITAFAETYDGQPVTRYRCLLKADSGTCYEFTAADIEKIIML